MEEHLKVIGVGGTLREGSTSLGALKQALAGAVMGIPEREKIARSVA